MRAGRSVYSRSIAAARASSAGLTVVRARCKAQDLYEVYQQWATTAGLRFPMSKNTLGVMLKERGFTPYKDGDGTRWWVGLQTAARSARKAMPARRS